MFEFCLFPFLSFSNPSVFAFLRISLVLFVLSRREALCSCALDGQVRRLRPRKRRVALPSSTLALLSGPHTTHPFQFTRFLRPKFKTATLTIQLRTIRARLALIPHGT